jgi:hypothetical protein
MRVSYDIKDYATVDRVYERFLSVVQPACRLWSRSKTVQNLTASTIDS